MIRLKALLALLLLTASCGFTTTASAQTASSPQSLSTNSWKPNWLQNTDFTLLYEINSDLASKRKPRLYNHAWELDVTQRLNEQHDVGASADFRYYSLNSDIPKNNDNLSFGDMSLYFVRKDVFYPWLKARQRLSWLLPTSEDSRYEGYRSLALGSSSWTAYLYKKYVSVTNTLGAQYIANTYRFSPTTLMINPDYAASNKVTLGFAPFSGFQIKLSTGVKAQHYLDKTTLMRFNNSAGLAYMWQDWAADVMYTNGSYADQSRYDLWFIDQYHQNVTASVSYGF